MTPGPVPWLSLDSAREEVPMHFIESLLGSSPDGGSGALEMVFLTLAVFISLRLVAVQRRRLKTH